MKTKLLILLAAFFIILNSCKSDDDNSGGQICTTEFVYGLSVTLKDASTDAFITEDVTITATDGIYQEALMTIEGIDSFYGAGERAGIYILSITSPNFQTFISDPVIVSEDACHVIGQVLEFLLQPN